MPLSGIIPRQRQVYDILACKKLLHAEARRREE